jgi:type II secretory pathway component PulK
MTKQSELKRAGAAKSASKTLKQSLPSSAAKVDLIPIKEAQERMGMTRSAFLKLRKELNIKSRAYKVNWNTVIERYAEAISDL